MLIALAARASAAPADRAAAAPTDKVAEAVRFANALTGVDADEEVAQRAPDDPDDQLAGTASSDDNDEAGDRDDDAGDVDDEAEARTDSAGDDAAEAQADGEPRWVRFAGDAGGDDASMGDVDVARSMAIDDDELDGDDAGLEDHASELALLDDEPANAVAITSDEAGYAAPAAGAAERYEQRMRRRRSWILGRLDVGLAWRQRQVEPRRSIAYVSNEVWLLATWRR